MPSDIKPMGPACEDYARTLCEHAPEAPNVVMVIFLRNHASEGRTALGVAATFEITDDEKRKVLGYALSSIGKAPPDV